MLAQTSWKQFTVSAFAWAARVIKLRRPGIRTVLLALSLGILALPLGGIAVLRLYESALVRQTETALIAQSALIAAMFRQTLIDQAPMVLSHTEYGRSAPPAKTSSLSGPWRPRPATLDLATSTLLPTAHETRVDGVADEVALQAGLHLLPILSSAQLTTLAGLRVTDHNGIVVATTGRDLGHALADSVEVANALRGNGTSTLRQRQPDADQPSGSAISRSATLRVYVSTPVRIENRIVGTVLAMRTPRTLGAALKANRELLFGAAVALLALAIVAGLLVSWAIVRPIKQLRVQALRAVDGEPGAMLPLESPVTRDVQQLSGAVSTMARTLEQRANTMREFASHVSHEFKTPLTAMRGSIELLLDHEQDMSESERRRFLENLDVDASRLNTLVTDLLQLTVHPPDASDSASIRDALSDSAIVSNARVSVQTDTSTPDLTVRMSTRTLVSILCSLIDNALDHGADNVSIAVSEGADTARIEVKDDGPGIDPAHRERIFEPFFTTRKDRSGHGLGLAIVASLMQSHSGRVRAMPCDTGARLELSLPLVSRNLVTAGS